MHPLLRPELLLENTPERPPGELQVGRVELTPPIGLIADEAGKHVRPGAHDPRLDTGYKAELIVETRQLCAGGLGHWVAHEKPTEGEHG